MVQESVASSGARQAVDTPPGRTGRWRRLPWLRMAAALVSGGVLYLAFPPVGWWPLAPLAVAVITLALRGVRLRHSALIGLMAGLGFFGTLLEWVSPIGYDAWFGAALIEALIFVPFAMAMTLVQRRFRVFWAPGVAGLWVAFELLRAHFPFGGFTWGRLAFSQSDSALTSYAALGGAPLVTFCVALTGALAAAAALSLHARRTVAGLVALVVALAIPAAGFLLPRGGTAGPELTVALVQGSVPGVGSMDFLGDEPARVLQNHVDETKKLASRTDAGTIDLVVWPENSSDLDAYKDPLAREKISEAARAIGVPILINSVVETPDGQHIRNRGILWDPRTGPGAYYDKRHLVPFGEDMPFRPIMEALFDRVDLVPRDFVADDRPGVMDVDSRDGTPETIRIGAVTCYEAAFDDIAREAVQAGGTMLAVQTNNATYGHTGLPPQQLAMSQLRAVEHNRAALVAATTGATAVIGPDGAIRRQIPLNAPGVLVADVPARTELTLATRIGEASEWVLALIGIGACAGAAWLGLRGRRSSP